MKNVLTLAEAAEELRVCRQTIYRMIKAGKIKSYLVGGKYLFDADELFDQFKKIN